MNNTVKFMRESKAYSQKQLGEMIGVSRQTINAIENGRYNPSIEVAFKLSNIFSVNIEQIFLYEGDNNDKE